MTPFTTATGTGALLALDNVDTDQLIPARFMKRSRSEGYGQQLLHDLRFDAQGAERAGFPLNGRAEPPMVLVAGANFGCGSSREAAVYALVDHGIRVVVAKGFADIFGNNAQRNGLLTLTLAPEAHDRLAARIAAAPGAGITVDLAAQTLRCAGLAPVTFDIDPVAKRRLLLGLDEIAETLQDLAAIERHEAAARAARPWLTPRPVGTGTGTGPGAG
ncbi:3-isopropylmalate dehydratase small subunit [Frigidibacter sp. MR17.24]|uniref:3-isopropylmalate dehydratase small subunit n=1 Tax=Frigidibacter sp. MR17.24 TaxID=3127345 RepID=UPI003012C8F3